MYVMPSADASAKRWVLGDHDNEFISDDDLVDTNFIKNNKEDL